MCKPLLALLVATTLSSCTLLDPLFDAPIQVVDPETGALVEVPLGDAIADNSAPVANAVGSAIGALNPVLGLMAAGALGTLLAGARRKKKQPSA